MISRIRKCEEFNSIASSLKEEIEESEETTNNNEEAPTGMFSPGRKRLKLISTLVSKFKESQLGRRKRKSRGESAESSVNLTQKPFFLTFREKKIEDEFIHWFYGKKYIVRLAIIQFVGFCIFFKTAFSFPSFPPHFEDPLYPAFYATECILAPFYLITGVLSLCPCWVKKISFKRTYELFLSLLFYVTLTYILLGEAYYYEIDGLFCFGAGFLFAGRLRVVSNFYILFTMCTFNLFFRPLLNNLLVPMTVLTYRGFEQTNILFIFHVLANAFQCTFIFLALHTTEKFQRKRFGRLLVIKQMKMKRKRKDQFMNVLLFNIIPKELINEVRKGVKTGYLIKKMESVVVVESDFASFTKFCVGMTSEKIIKTMNMYFTEFDILTNKMSATKIKTAGDRYSAMFASKDGDWDIETRGVMFGIAKIMSVKRIAQRNGDLLSLRVGIDVGPIVLCAICRRNYSFDCFGETRSRSMELESRSPLQCLNVSERVWETTKEYFDFKKLDDGYLLDVRSDGSVLDAQLKSKLEEILKDDQVELDFEMIQKDAERSTLENEQGKEAMCQVDKKKLCISSNGILRPLCVFKSKKMEKSYREHIDHLSTPSRAIFVLFFLLYNLLDVVSVVCLREWQYLISGYMIATYVLCFLAFVLLVLFPLIQKLFGRFSLFGEILSLAVFLTTLLPLGFMPNRIVDKPSDNFVCHYFYRALLEVFLISFCPTSVLWLKILFYFIYTVFYTVKILVITFNVDISNAWFHPLSGIVPFLITLVSVVIHSVTMDSQFRSFFAAREHEMNESRLLKIRVKRNRNLILSTLPKSIVLRIFYGEELFDQMDGVICFLRIQNCSNLSMELFVKQLAESFVEFDDICQNNAVWKVKTSETYYLCLAKDLAPMLVCLKEMISFFTSKFSPMGSRLKIGVCEGSLSTGVVGWDKLLWDCFGEPCNIASRLCDTSSHENGIHVIENNIEESVRRCEMPVSLRKHQTIFLKGLGETNTCYVEFSEGFEEFGEETKENRNKYEIFKLLKMGGSNNSIMSIESC